MLLVLVLSMVVVVVVVWLGLPFCLLCFFIIDPTESIVSFFLSVMGDGWGEMVLHRDSINGAKGSIFITDDVLLV